jgi:uncharacterized protein (DUF1697 family)
MSTRVAFLRAVNLGARTVKMARLAEIVRSLGHEDVWTYINSGNVVFDASGSRTDLERSLEEAFEAEFGFETTTFVRSAVELRRAMAVEPFALSPGDTYFVTFLKEVPSSGQRADLEALTNDMDELVVHGRDVHWLMHGKSTDTTITSKRWADIVGARRSTSRNTTMLRKLVEKIDQRR